MKSYRIIIAFLLVLMLFTACKSEPVELPQRAYVMEASTETMKPTFTPKDDGTCTFVYSGLSSYLPVGTYTIDGSRLIMSTGDGGYTYVFDMRDDKLYFNESESSKLPEFANVPDGAEFK